MTASSPVTIDIRDPSITDPVALVTAHLDGGATVTIRDSANAVPNGSVGRLIPATGMP